MDEHRFDALPPVHVPAEQTGEASAEVPTPSMQGEQVSQTVERTPAGSGFVDPNAPQPSLPVPAPVAPISAPAPLDGATPSATLALTPLMADDTDLIEKEWVEKAKQIVEHTRDDPHRQNEEINKVKADYLKKRYNHDLKLDDK